MAYPMIPMTTMTMMTTAMMVRRSPLDSPEPRWGSGVAGCGFEGSDITP
jgi:hypothetical protein